MSATKFSCSRADCTVGVTGRCLDSFDDPVACPHATGVAAGLGTASGTAAVSATLTAARRFHPGHELGFRDALAITRARYAHFVGILGPVNAGKTCFLTSLYLSACHGLLAPEFRFAGSMTLQGFELRARGLRSWSGGSLADQVVEHTSLSDPRNPAFVHLALDRTTRPTVRSELLLSDLPGEWTTQLINRADQAARFEFLARADAVAIVVEGPRLDGNTTRHQEVASTRQLLERLHHDVKLSPAIPLLLLVSKIDELGGTLPPATASIQDAAERLGFTLNVVPTAAFSRDPARVPNGAGVLEALRLMLAPGREIPCPPASTLLPVTARSFLRPCQEVADA